MLPPCNSKSAPQISVRPSPVLPTDASVVELVLCHNKGMFNRTKEAAQRFWTDDLTEGWYERNQ